MMFVGEELAIEEMEMYMSDMVCALFFSESLLILPIYSQVLVGTECS